MHIPKQIGLWSLSLALVGLSLSSCIKDESKDVSYNVSELTLASGGLEEAYTVRQNETLRLTAPTLNQSNGDKPLSYEWRINGEVVSTERTLSYQASRTGTFSALLVVRNEDGGYFHRFRLQVDFSYLTGYYMLSDSLGKPMISYLPDDSNYPFEPDALWSSNADALRENAQLFQGEATAMDFVGALNDEQFVFALKEASGRNAIYRISAATMTYLDRATELSREINYIHSRLEHQGRAIYMIEEGGRPSEVFDIWSSPIIPQNGGFATLFNGNRRLPAEGLAPKVISWRDERSARVTTYEGSLFFDDNVGQVYGFRGDQAAVVTGGDLTSFNGSIRGLKFVDMITLDNVGVQRRVEVAMVLRNPTTNQYTLFRVRPRQFRSFGMMQAMPFTDLGSRPIPASAGFTPESRLVSTRVQGIPFIYYSSGSGVYAMSTAEGAPFPTAPEFSVDAGESIVAMGFSADDSRLYVATNSDVDTAGNGLVGHFYTFDRTTRERVEKKANVVGRIKALVYRPAPLQ